MTAQLSELLDTARAGIRTPEHELIVFRRAKLTP
jgi:hypothetical protein